ncbi:hypothetical protein HPB47_020609, partial [Ixodes persulcatus]
LVTISSIKNDQARANAIAVLQREFPASSEFENEIRYKQDSGLRIQKCGNGKLEQ